MKRLILVIFLGLLFCGSVFSQSLQGQWRLQNPNNPSSQEINYFGPNTYMCVGFNALTGQSYMGQGMYSVSDNILTLQQIDGKIMYLKITWNSPNQVVLSTENMRCIYAKISANYVAPSVPGNNVYNNNASQVCYTCLGTGRCRVCGGTGTYSIYGESKPCSACSGDGKCWHCKGSGKQ